LPAAQCWNYKGTPQKIPRREWSTAKLSRRRKHYVITASTAFLLFPNTRRREQEDLWLSSTTTISLVKRQCHTYRLFSSTCTPCTLQPAHSYFLLHFLSPIWLLSNTFSAHSTIPLHLFQKATVSRNKHDSGPVNLHEPAQLYYARPLFRSKERVLHNSVGRYVVDSHQRLPGKEVGNPPPP
jgi:hypothetical protein